MSVLTLDKYIFYYLIIFVNRLVIELDRMGSVQPAGKIQINNNGEPKTMNPQYPSLVSVYHLNKQYDEDFDSIERKHNIKGAENNKFYYQDELENKDFASGIKYSDIDELP